MLDWWRRVLRAGRPAAELSVVQQPTPKLPAEEVAAPAEPRVGEAHWLIVPHEGHDEALEYGVVGEPWRGVIVRDFGGEYFVRPPGDLDVGGPTAVARDEDLLPTAEAARDAYIEALRGVVEHGRPTPRPPLGPGGVPAAGPRVGPTRDARGAEAPAIHGRYWLIAPIHDTLNLGYGFYRPWRGIVAEVRGEVFIVAPEEDAGPDGLAPLGVMRWRDAYVNASELHETEGEAWDAYNEAVAAEDFEELRRWARWAEELPRWERAREQGLPRPPRVAGGDEVIGPSNPGENL